MFNFAGILKVQNDIEWEEIRSIYMTFQLRTRLLVNTTKNEDGEEQFNIEMDFKGLEMSMLKMFKSGVAEEPEPEVDDEDEEDDG